MFVCCCFLLLFFVYFVFVIFWGFDFCFVLFRVFFFVFVFFRVYCMWSYQIWIILTDLFNPQIGFWQVVPLRVSIDLGLMATNVYSTLPRYQSILSFTDRTIRSMNRMIFIDSTKNLVVSYPKKSSEVDQKLERKSNFNTGKPGWFEFFLSHINFCELLNARINLLEEQQSYYLVHSWGTRGFIPFPRVNVWTWT